MPTTLADDKRIFIGCKISPLQSTNTPSHPETEEESRC
jgi:hypothetical protein